MRTEAIINLIEQKASINSEKLNLINFKSHESEDEEDDD